ncbi:hypothetical protein [Streptomyces sp. C1-2]|uniref:hypothetical protein n=1 Tax=Streptomyces sp. C1-2 TaxID=2720022 RepID=UPI00143264DC|nr:hypothetical protein [Streptomyces sp. C1-2]NJP73194.1 hypothetical protein [Streptomyces sp. C1-2]
MIPATRPAYVARYRHRHEASDTTHFSTKPVVAWDDNRRALVVDEKSGRLVDADSYSNFAGVMESRGTQYIGALPGDGWLAEYRGEDGGTFTFSVVAWNVKSDGDLEPICVDRDGFASNPTEDQNFQRLYHPGQETSAPGQSD